jgi:hypothetical protein
MPLLRPPEVTPRAVRGSDEPVTVWCVVSRRTGQSASRLFAQKATEYSLVGYAIGTCRRTGAPLHRHGNAWNFCAFGAKRWFLLPERAQHTNKPPRTPSRSRLSAASACAQRWQRASPAACAHQWPILHVRSRCCVVLFALVMSYVYAHRTAGPR